MFRFSFSLISGLAAMGLFAFPVIVHAADWEFRQAQGIAKQEAGMYALRDYGLNSPTYEGQYGYYYGPYGYPNPVYDPNYGGNYYNYPYSTYPSYPNPYMYPRYRPYYYNPGMYNPDTNFINPPSSLNYPTGYPMYSETYIRP